MKHRWRHYLPWIDYVLIHLDITPTDWCRMANLAPSTLLRAIKYPDIGGPSLDTLYKLQHAVGIPIPESIFSLNPRVDSDEND